MNSGNLLDDIWEAYQTATDCLKIASRSIDKCEYHLLNKTDFTAIPPNTAVQRIETSRSGVNDYVILSLWAAFERELYNYLQNECSKLLENNGSEFNKAVHKKIDKESEYWRIDDILDIFKILVNSSLIGDAKKIKKYRDWIAHRNPRKAVPDNVSPKHTYKVLSEILSCLASHPDLS